MTDARDDQDQAETFDETHLDDEGNGDFLPDEADPVLDITQADALLGVDGERINEIDGESTGQRGDDEVELVYSGLMENARGAQASAAHWEAKRLSDDDIADLGYGPDGEDHPVR